MPEDKSHTQWAPRQFSPHRRCSGKKQTDLRGEDSILELISLGAPLPEVLNQLCTAIDLQIGNVVSLILLEGDEENDPQTIAHSALRFGLHVFWSASIPLRDEASLGSFEMYCCISRTPTPFELRLIQRVTHLAELAIRRHNGEEDFESTYGDWNGALGRRSHEGARLN